MTTPDKDPIKEIINKSGNDLHLKTAHLLQAQGWEVVVSQYYSDPATNKPREIDIIAEKEYKAKELGKFTIQLFIECKYISEPVVWWFGEKNLEKALKLTKDNYILRHKEDLDLTTLPTHHYLETFRVGKLTEHKGQKDPFYDAMNGCLNACISYKDSLGVSKVRFPLILIDSFKNLHERDDQILEGHKPLHSQFQWEVDYSDLNQQAHTTNQYYLLDIVGHEELSGFIDSLEQKDIALMQQTLYYNLRTQRRADIDRQSQIEDWRNTNY